MRRLLLIGLNHTTAPLAVRERVALPLDKQAALLVRLQQVYAAEAVLLSTCNRVELYAAADKPLDATAAIAALAEVQGIAVREIDTHTYRKTGREVVEHLFAVACSLDSMVPGETQILGQVRDAYARSTDAGVIGPLLHPLFQRAIAVGKSVMTDTPLASGRASVGSAAVDYATQIFETFADKTVLCIGAGKMASTVLMSLSALKPGRLIICNRDESKAEVLAQKFSGVASSLDRLDEHLVAADIVVTSTGSPVPIITRKRFESLRRRRRFRPIFMIDIAVPRDVEPAVGEMDGVYLYNVDDLQSVVANSMAGRQGAMDAARAIVHRAVEEHLVSHRAREMGPTIDQLYQRSHALAREELERVIGKLPAVGDAERAHLEDLTRRIVNKLLHEPVRTLRESGGAHVGSRPYLHAVQKLFQLDEQTQTPPANAASDAAPEPSLFEDAAVRELRDAVAAINRKSATDENGLVP